MKEAAGREAAGASFQKRSKKQIVTRLAAAPGCPTSGTETDPVAATIKSAKKASRLMKADSWLKAPAEGLVKAVKKKRPALPVSVYGVQAANPSKAELVQDLKEFRLPTARECREQTAGRIA